jgi:AraC-like DNA-binding protein
LFDRRNSEERTHLLIRLAMLELRQAEDSTSFIPLPQDPRCRRAAMLVLGDPTATHDIETLARKVGTSARTLSRQFSVQTQLSFKSWCQRARIASAIERLSTDANVSVKQLASNLGYASVPAFSHAFRQVTGKTPTEFARKD